MICDQREAVASVVNSSKEQFPLLTEGGGDELSIAFNPLFAESSSTEDAHLQPTTSPRDTGLLLELSIFVLKIFVKVF